MSLDLQIHQSSVLLVVDTEPNIDMDLNSTTPRFLQNLKLKANKKRHLSEQGGSGDPNVREHQVKKYKPDISVTPVEDEVPKKIKIEPSSENGSTGVYRKHADASSNDRVDGEQNITRRVEAVPNMDHASAQLVKNDRKCTRLKVPVKEEFGQSSGNLQTEEYRENKEEVGNIDRLPGRAVGELNVGMQVLAVAGSSKMEGSERNNPPTNENTKAIESIDHSQNRVAGEQNRGSLFKPDHPESTGKVVQVRNEFGQSRENPPAGRIPRIHSLQERIVGEGIRRSPGRIEPNINHQGAVVMVEPESARKKVPRPDGPFPPLWIARPEDVRRLGVSNIKIDFKVHLHTVTETTGGEFGFNFMPIVKNDLQRVGIWNEKGDVNTQSNPTSGTQIEVIGYDIMPIDKNGNIGPKAITMFKRRP